MIVSIHLYCAEFPSYFSYYISIAKKKKKKPCVKEYLGHWALCLIAWPIGPYVLFSFRKTSSLMLKKTGTKLSHI